MRLLCIFTLCIYGVSGEAEYRHPPEGRADRGETQRDTQNTQSCVDVERRVAALQANLEESEYALSNYKVAIQETDAKFVVLEAQVEALNEKTNLCETEAASKESKIEEIEKIAVLYTGLQEKYQEKEKEIQQLLSENAKRHKTEANDEELNKIKNLYTQLEKKYEVAEKEKKELLSENAKRQKADSSDGDVKKMTDLYTQLEKKYEEKEKDLQKLLSEKTQHAKEIQKHENKNKEMENNVRELQKLADKANDKFDYETFVNPWVNLAKFFYGIEKYYFNFAKNNIPNIPVPVKENMQKIHTAILDILQPVRESLTPIYSQVTNAVVKNYYVCVEYYNDNLKDNIVRIYTKVTTFVKTRFSILVANSNKFFDKMLQPILKYETKQKTEKQKNTITNFADMLASPTEIAIVFWMFCLVCYFQINLIRKICMFCVGVILSVLLCVFCCRCSKRERKAKKEKRDRGKETKSTHTHTHTHKRNNDSDGVKDKIPRKRKRNTTIII